MHSQIDEANTVDDEQLFKMLVDNRIKQVALIRESLNAVEIPDHSAMSAEIVNLKELNFELHKQVDLVNSEKNDYKRRFESLRDEYGRLERRLKKVESKVGRQASQATPSPSYHFELIRVIHEGVWEYRWYEYVAGDAAGDEDKSMDVADAQVRIKTLLFGCVHCKMLFLSNEQLDAHGEECRGRAKRENDTRFKIYMNMKKSRHPYRCGVKDCTKAYNDVVELRSHMLKHQHGRLRIKSEVAGGSK